MNLESQQKTNAVLTRSSAQQFSNAQPVLHLVLLSIATLGIYEIYWFYRNWKQFKLHKNLKISPLWRTVGLSIPIYGLVLAYRQLRDIRDFAKEAGIAETYSPGWALTGWFVLSFLGGLPGPLWLLSFLSIWPIVVVQRILNTYWAKEQPGYPVKTKFSRGQIVLLVIGGFLLILIVIGSVVPG